MAFASRYADLIWDRLYTVLIPDHLTQDPEYLRKFGTYATQNREVDQMVTTNCITVMIPIIKIVEYFDKGIEVQIPSREDMLQMHRDIELYLGEWEEQLRRNINLTPTKYKKLIASLEQLSKRIYDKAQPAELVRNLFVGGQSFLQSPTQSVQPTVAPEKPAYKGIASGIKSKAEGRFG